MHFTVLPGVYRINLHLICLNSVLLLSPASKHLSPAGLYLDENKFLGYQICGLNLSDYHIRFIDQTTFKPNSLYLAAAAVLLYHLKICT